MKRRFFTLLTMLSLAVGFIGFSFAETTDSVEASGQTNSLAAQLPASDGVAVVDIQRLMKDALPQLLTSKVGFLGEILSVNEKFKAQTGVELKDFEQIAIGINFKEVAPQKVTFDPLVLARGKMSVASLLETAKTASKGKYREEKSGAKTIYVFAAKDVVQDNQPQATNPQQAEELNKVLSRIPSEVAMTVFDNNTLAMGSLARVRDAIEGKPRVSPALLTLATRKPTSIIGFAANMPKNAAQLFNLDDDIIGSAVDSIQQVYGMIEVVGANTQVSIAAKTYRPEQAKDLNDSLEGFRMIGASVLNGSKGDDKRIYAKMVEAAKITRVGSEVKLDVLVANSDLLALIGK